ncbi:hypothetical protein ACEWY4_001452 [Coilia grayii]|uniref:Uncharacterized protein n=1 Tax=Coilia grayii TaxID=363190 RepID=A0ABD1KSZ2_9TELE
MYVDAVGQKKLPALRTSSYDPLILAKFHFYMAIARTFTPFLTKYQTDEPVLPFISQDLTVLIKSLLKRFIRSEVLSGITPLQLVKLDSTDKAARVQLKNVDIGLGAEAVLKELQSRPNSSITELRELKFRQDCLDLMTKIIQTAV